MKSLRSLTVLIALAGSIQFASGQASPSPAPAAGSSARPEVYHVHFNRAAPGKAAALATFLKTPAPDAAMAGHSVLLQHEDGAGWDYVNVQDMGTKATVEASGNPRGPSMKGMSEWHTDTFANGPAWAEFAKEMGLDDAGKSKSAESVYVVSTYRALPGKEDALEKFLSAPPAGDTAVGNVLMQHLEGDSWRFLAIARYKSWQDFASSEAAAVAETIKGKGHWFDLRDMISLHEDTLTFRVQ
ncbi:MAG: hypothetical protein M3Y86_10875 [Verrucomicrobiota bacterium]|nr:hypothetical protein [Verrucomicrobiota bacterium]